MDLDEIIENLHMYVQSLIETEYARGWDAGWQAGWDMAMKAKDIVRPMSERGH